VGRWRFAVVAGAVVLTAVLMGMLMAPRGVAARSVAGDWVMVPKGQPVQVAFTEDTTEAPIFTDFSASARNAVQMAIENHPTIKGFPIQVNEVQTTCLATDNTASATAIVGNAQNTAVLGNLCSGGFATALPIYQAAGLVTVSGSASSSSLPPLGPTVFNRTIVVSDQVGDAGDQWI